MGAVMLSGAFDHRAARPLASVPLLSPEGLAGWIGRGIEAGWRIVAFFGLPGDSGTSLVAVLAHDREACLAAARSHPAERFESLTPRYPQAHLFEREIFEQWGVLPENHPWLKPVRFHESGGGGGARTLQRPRPAETSYFRVEGPEIHEVAVGPVHAGIIEPGHFRFQCHGEVVLHLEIALGYQHRGAEALLAKDGSPRTARLVETLSGDASISHALAHQGVREALCGFAASPRGLAIRTLALELERLANHTGDLGALAGDVGYLPTLSYCGRIRGDFLNMTASLCGNRFGRGLVAPGGAAFDVDDALARDLLARLAAARRDVIGATDLLFASATAMNRFEGTGRLSVQTALDLGLVGPPARACGLARDARRTFPPGAQACGFAANGSSVPAAPLCLRDEGDVFARAMVRRLEVEASLGICERILNELPGGEIAAPAGMPEAGAPDSLAVGVAEGWRGEVWHVAVTGEGGKTRAYKVVDPSFHNWTGLAMALRGEQISDFPLCNKSFNLSYCGHDL